MRAKARFVLGEMERPMTALGAGWRDTTPAQAYTVCDLHPFLNEEIVGRCAARHDLAWHSCRPPVVGLDFEMDCREVAVQRVLPAWYSRRRRRRQAASRSMWSRTRYQLPISGSTQRGSPR